MVFVGKRSAWDTDEEISHFLKQGNSSGEVVRLVVAVPDGEVHAEMPCIHRAQHVGGLDAHVHRCGWRLVAELNVVHVKCGGGTTGTKLDVDARKVRLVRHPERT